MLKKLSDTEINSINHLCAASNVNSDVAVFIKQINDGTYTIDILVDDYSVGGSQPRKRKISLTASQLQRKD